MARHWGAAALVGATWLAGAAAAQMDPMEEQRCVWQCLANSPGADSRQYDDCVARMCVGEEPPAPAAAALALPTAAWKAGAAAGGAHYAAVDVPNAAMTFVCTPDGAAQLGIAGAGSRADAVDFRVDDRVFRLRFVAKKGVLFTAAPPGSPLLGALTGGAAATVLDKAGGHAVSFPLTGSGAAIGAALAGCGLR